MKKLIVIFTCLFFYASFALAVDNAYGTQITNIITTPGDINSNTFLNGNNIDNNIYCSGSSCSTNVYGNDVNVPSGQNFTYNSYNTQNYNGGGGGLSITGLTYNLGIAAKNYYDGNYSRYGGGTAWGFWSLMDAVFVSHKESQASFNNIIYLANKADRLEAKINIIEKMFNLTDNADYLKQVDAEETRLYVQRTGDVSCFNDGQCVVVKNVK